LAKPLTVAAICVMLTTEVVYILKKALLLALALVFAVCSHLRPCCDFTVEGRLIQSGCSIAAARRAKEAALFAAEEILPGKAALPAAKLRLGFSLKGGKASAPALSDALLRATPGVLAGDGVYLDGQKLGCVAEGRELRQEIAAYIENTLPSWAKAGSLGGYLELRRQYTRAAYEVTTDDMIMLITGLKPVMYTDGEGRVSPV